MGKKANPTIIGLFVVGALALAVAGVVVFGSGQFFKNTEEFVMFFPGSVNGLTTGAPVKFKGVAIGQVTDIKLVMQREARADEQLTIPVFVQTDPSKIFVDGNRLEMTDPNNLRQLIERGMRGQLQSQSLVTGLLFVQIDFFPDTPINYVLPQPSEPMEIPTIPTTLEQASSVAREIIDELRSVKFGPMVQDASEALDSLKVLLSSPALQQSIDALPATIQHLDATIATVNRLSAELQGHVGPFAKRLDTTLVGADQTLTSVRDTVGAARTLIEPGAPLDHELRKTLQDVSAAARALAQLADYLERNPTALLYGKQAPPPGANR
jgi:paraquat-inducible protein B